MTYSLEYTPPNVKQFIARLHRVAANKQNNLKVLHEGRERILVELYGEPYLFFIPWASAELTPGRISNRVAKWPRLKGQDIRGHIILATNADISASVIASDGANLPPRVAVVGKWGTANRVAAANSDKGMSYLLELAGVQPAEIKRSRRRKPVKRSSKKIGTPTGNRELPAPIVQQPWRPQLHKNMKLDSYNLVQRLGRGYSAEVWKATLASQIAGVPLNPGTTVAMKIYSPAFLQGLQPIRIHREFTVAVDILHENLARVYDLLISPSRPFHTFMVMEFINGPTLKDYITASGKISANNTVRVGSQIFSALTELHSLGVIHRDVKAANIMLSKQESDDIRIKLVDLGIVAVTADERFTAASVFLGSKHLAPLEQLRGGELDERTDIYGVGSVLYHCLLGTPMYPNVGPEGAIVWQMLHAPERLKATASAGPAERALIEFVNSCIEVEPKNRPSTANQCLSTLSSIQSLL